MQRTTTYGHLAVARSRLENKGISRRRGQRRELRVDKAA